ncbi:hypothetical protein WJX72_008044 [[Myrmecia] bisecta]|uniref:Uncharacterized protein n=1 Tax=[Myrmecia] bisecta TaxID=41462 RepID=A0AAW1PG24_9CHLO
MPTAAAHVAEREGTAPIAPGQAALMAPFPGLGAHYAMDYNNQTTRDLLQTQVQTVTSHINALGSGTDSEDSTHPAVGDAPTNHHLTGVAAAPSSQPPSPADSGPATSPVHVTAMADVNLTAAGQDAALRPYPGLIVGIQPSAFNTRDFSNESFILKKMSSYRSRERLQVPLMLSNASVAEGTAAPVTTTIDPFGKHETQATVDTQMGAPQAVPYGGPSCFSGFDMPPIFIVHGLVSAPQIINSTDLDCFPIGTRIWGGPDLAMVDTVLQNSDCWLAHLTVNHTRNITLAPVQGHHAISRVGPRGGVDVWWRFFEEMRRHGYTNDTMGLVNYDWRQDSMWLIDHHDYAWQVQFMVERLYNMTCKKVAVISHSYGDPVFRAIWTHIEEAHPGWSEKHLFAYISIGGAPLGVPKAEAALRSGEMHDVAKLGTFARILSWFALTPKAAKNLLSSWPCIYGDLYLQGGCPVWGTESGAPDDTEEMQRANVTYGGLVIKHRVDDMQQHLAVSHYYLQHLHRRLRRLGSWIAYLLSFYKQDTVFTEVGSTVLNVHQAALDRGHDKLFSLSASPINPLSRPLPNATAPKVYVLYGYGLLTERGYHYLQEGEGENATFAIDTSVFADLPPTSNGVMLSDGDGTVPLCSLGLLALEQNRSSGLNPGGMPIYIREYPHGGRKGESADHVAILSHKAVQDDIIAILKGNPLPTHITSSINTIHSRYQQLHATATERCSRLDNVNQPPDMQVEKS